MKNNSTLYTLGLVFLTFVFSQNTFAQKGGKVYAFNYGNNTFTLVKGSKLQLGKGSNYDGSFAFVERDEVIRKRESYNNNSGATSSQSTDFYTGNKEYLRGFYANKTVTIKRVKFFKKMDQYQLFVFTTDGVFTLHLEDAINKGEVIAVNGKPIGNDVPVAVTQTGAVQPYVSANNNGMKYTLYLKNGSSIKCNVLEMVPNDFVKVETADKSVFVFKMNEVKELKDETLSSNSNTPVSNPTVTTTNNNGGFSQASYQPVSKRDTTPLGSFYNSTEVFVNLPNGKDDVNDYTVSVIGFGAKNVSGYQFKDIAMLGGGVAFGSYLDENVNANNYHVISFGLDQKFFVLGKKKVSPEISAYQYWGSMINSISAPEGGFQNYGFSAGVRVKLNKNFYLSPSLGYTHQIFSKDVTRGSGQYAYTSNEGGQANYFTFHLGFSFKK